MKTTPNTETIRHLCHFHGGKQYYLLSGSETKNPILVTDVSDIEQLTEELLSWCGMIIDVFSTQDQGEIALYVIKHGVALHLAAESVKLTEE